MQGPVAGGGRERARRVIGVDAGGSKTLALLADGHGRVLAEARDDGANLLVHGGDGVAAVLRRILAALDGSEDGGGGGSEDDGPAGDRPDGRADALCLGIAGAGRPEDVERVEAILRRLGWRRPARVVHDAHIALVAGAPEGVGIVVVAGTGSVAYGVDPSGSRARAGGWGHILGDEGSAFWLGHAAIRRGIRAADGRGPATSLGDRVSRHLGLERAQELIPWFYDREHTRRRLAELAPLVEAAAGDGDPSAEELLDEAAHHLARAARAVARQLTLPDRYPVVLAGGAFKACPSLVRRIDERLDLHRSRLVKLEVEPAAGAVRLALELLERGE